MPPQPGSPELDTTPAIVPLPKLKKPWRAKLPILVGGSAMIALAALTLFATVNRVDQQQQLGSKAAAGENSWFTFDPPTYSTSPGAQTQPPPPPIVRINKSGNRKISTVQLEFSYNPANISNLNVTLLEWAKNKPPAILEPFATQVTNGQGRATITLGAPCDQKKCYPLKKNATNLLILSFQALATSTIDVTNATYVTMTGDSANTFQDDLTSPLTVIKTN